MSRADLRRALEGQRTDPPVLLPLVGRHAARLEQVSDAAFRDDPEIQARALRNAQALYGYDAITVGAGGDGLATAAGEGALPEPAVLLAHPGLGVEIGALERLRAVVGEKAALALVLPTPGRLREQLGERAPPSWCAGVVLGALRQAGPAEPDLVFWLGEDDPGLRLGALCDHFGIRSVWPPALAGHAHLVGGAHLAQGTIETDGSLCVTTSEIPPETEPAVLQRAIDRIKGRTA